MAFSDSTDGRIAGHYAQRFDIVGEQKRGTTRAGAGQSGFRSGVSATDHDYIELFRVAHSLPTKMRTRIITQKLFPTLTLRGKLFHVKHS
jgi:hypothetical protein